MIVTDLRSSAFRVGLADSSEIPLLLDSRFPLADLALFSDTSSVHQDALVKPLPRSQVHARVTSWAPGSMTIALDGRDVRAGHLIVAENWYPDWRATVDGRTATVRRVDHTLLSVDLPASAREVRLWFAGTDYARGKEVSLVSLILAVGMIGAALVMDRRGAAKG